MAEEQAEEEAPRTEIDDLMEDWLEVSDNEETDNLMEDWVAMADKIKIVGNMQAKMVGALFKLNYGGRVIIPDNWRTWLRPEKNGKLGRFDYVAADMLAHLCRWNAAWWDKKANRWRTNSKSTKDGVNHTLTYFANGLGHSLYQVREGLRSLKAYELITATESRRGQTPSYLIKLNLRNLALITLTKRPPLPAKSAKTTSPAKPAKA
jgi:hypothetical protein